MAIEGTSDAVQVHVDVHVPDEDQSVGDLRDVDLQPSGGNSKAPAHFTEEEKKEFDRVAQVADAKSAEDEKWWDERFCEQYGDWGKKGAVGFWGKCGWVGTRVIYTCDFIGEVFADFLGLNQSRYQYVVDAYEREQYRLRMARQEQELERKMLEELEGKELDNLEGGAPASATDADSIEASVSLSPPQSQTQETHSQMHDSTQESTKHTIQSTHANPVPDAKANNDENDGLITV